MKLKLKRDYALDLHSAGRTNEEIAKAMECHISHIERWIREAGRQPWTEERVQELGRK